MNQKQFFESLFPTGLIELRAIDLKNRVVTGRAFARDINKVTEFCTNHSTHEVYFGVAPRMKIDGGGGLGNCAPLECLWVDIDFKTTLEADAREALALMDNEPNIIVNSGGGLHCYWLLRDKFPARDAKDALRMLAKQVGGDLQSAEAAHVLRIPGTLNHKYSPPRLVRIESADLERRIDDARPVVVAAPIIREEIGGGESGVASLEMARAWLNEWPGAVEGEGGDAHTFVTACRLVRDYALRETDALRLISDWNERVCSPPWSLEDLTVKLRSALQYGTGDIGSADPAEDFADLTGEDAVVAALELSLLEKMSVKFKAIDEDGKLRIYTQRREETLKRDVWVKYARRDFLEVCASVLHYPMIEVGVNAKGDPKFAPAAVVWLDNYKKKITYQGVVFAPEHEGDKTPDGRLNLWRGFSVKAKKGTWDYMKALMFETLCASETEPYEYVMNWLARAVQRPWEPGGVALVFKGPKGTGKGTLARAFVSLFGRHGLHITSPSLLVGRFNAHLRDVAALFADEAFWAGDKGGEGILKGLVTEPTIAYEGKGSNAEMGRNCTHIIMASNEDWVIPAGLDKERRFAVMQVEDDQRDRMFWEKLREEMSESKGGLAAMLWELKMRDISGFNLFAVPNTQALVEQKVRTMEPSEQWLYDLLDSGQWNSLPYITKWQPGNRMIVLCRDMQASLLSFYKDHNRFRPGVESMSTHLGIMIMKMMPSVHKIRVALPPDRAVVNDSPNARLWAYVLPSEFKARSEFARSVGGKLWSD